MYEITFQVTLPSSLVRRLLPILIAHVTHIYRPFVCTIGVVGVSSKGYSIVIQHAQ